MSIATCARRLAAGSVAAATIASAFLAASPAQAVRTLFYEQTAQAFWAPTHQCDDGTVVQGTLLVQPTRDFNAPDTEDPDPTTRVQFLAVCPNGTSFSWAAPVAPSTITVVDDLVSMSTSGSGIARDNLGGTHTVSFDATWTGVGPIETTVNTPGSKTKIRQATATGRVVFDGVVIADGPPNHPTRPGPFIRVDTEK